MGLFQFYSKSEVAPAYGTTHLDHDAHIQEGVEERPWVITAALIVEAVEVTVVISSEIVTL